MINDLPSTGPLSTVTITGKGGTGSRLEKPIAKPRKPIKIIRTPLRKIPGPPKRKGKSMAELITRWLKEEGITGY